MTSNGTQPRVSACLLKPKFNGRSKLDRGELDRGELDRGELVRLCDLVASLALVLRTNMIKEMLSDYILEILNSAFIKGFMDENV